MEQEEDKLLCEMTDSEWKDFARKFKKSYEKFFDKELSDHQLTDEELSEYYS